MNKAHQKNSQYQGKTYDLTEYSVDLQEDMQNSSPSKFSKLSQSKVSGGYYK